MCAAKKNLIPIIEAPSNFTKTVPMAEESQLIKISRQTHIKETADSIISKNLKAFEALAKL